MASTKSKQPRKAKGSRKARRAILAQQEAAADAARGRLNRRDAFASLTADQHHHVLRPISDAFVITGAGAVSLARDQLRDAFDRVLPIADREADDRLDVILSEIRSSSSTRCRTTLATANSAMPASSIESSASCVSA